jgi:hypothetical protein
MHAEAIRSFQARLLRIMELLETRSVWEVDWNKDKFITGEVFGCAYVFGTGGWEEYRKLVLGLLKQRGWAARFSEAYIQTAIQRMSKATDDPDILGPELLKFLIASENYDREQIVTVPVQSLQLPLGDLEVGNVVFRPVTLELLEALLEGTSTSRDAFFSRSPIWVIAQCRVIAEPQRARERAEEEVRAAIDILSYALGFAVKPGRLLTVGIQNDAVFGVRRTLVRNSQSDAYVMHGSGVGDSVVLSSEIIGRLHRAGLSELSQVLKSDKRSEFENTLLMAIHWYADAHNQRQVPNRVLSLITALETTFSKPEAGRSPDRG